MERRPVALRAGGKDSAGDHRVRSKHAFVMMAATSGTTMGSSPVSGQAAKIPQAITA